MWASPGVSRRRREMPRTTPPQFIPPGARAPLRRLWTVSVLVGKFDGAAMTPLRGGGEYVWE